MSRARIAARSMRALALVPAGAFAVHQLRYLLAYGGRAGSELTAQGHSYLGSFVPWIVLLVGLAAGGFLRALARALVGRRSAPPRAHSLLTLWAACATCLLAIYVAQEFLEGLFATGHPGGIAGIFGGGGLWSIPAAGAVGLLLALLLRGSSLLLDVLARWHARRPPARRAPRAGERRARVALAARLSPAAAGRPVRGPPS